MKKNTSQGPDPAAGVELGAYMRHLIDRLRHDGRLGTAANYAAALNSFMHFRQGCDLPAHRLSTALIADYEAHLSARGVGRNTSSFYLRCLRAAYHRAVGGASGAPDAPFRHAYTGVERTIKRAVPLGVLRRIKTAALPERSAAALARDLFLFSFYTRGMAFVDMAFLRRSDLQGGILTYRRQKTGRRLSVGWEPCMQAIVDRWADHSVPPYLLPIVREPARAWLQYKNAARHTNRHLKMLGQRLGLAAPLTLYVARHTWASLARSQHVPIGIISEGMGHDSERTTRIYLTSLGTTAVDRANRKLLRLV